MEKREWVQRSLQLEAEMISFYADCIANTTNHHARSLFDYLLREEKKHHIMFTRLSVDVRNNNHDGVQRVASEFLTTTPAQLQIDYDNIPKATKQVGLAPSLEKAIKLEEEAISFYTALTADAPSMKGVLQKLIVEEKNHKRTLSLVRRRLFG